MRATARRLQGSLSPEIEIGSLRFAIGAASGPGAREGAPGPEELLAASLAACGTLAIEAYAKRQGWEIGEVVIEVDYEIAKRGSPARCEIVVRLPDRLPEEQHRRLMRMAATSPVRRSLEGETMFDERLELAPTRPELVPAVGGRPRRPSEGNHLLRRLRGRLPSAPR
jgi:putative redox protein